ncbi:hypothetical protein JG687_00006245 [Phytophthora cactorum]|uniref:Uncharacterized protein n=1 Tax=Phytophthora cactorum TaxID=29920 RepID=A0A329SMA4_9STRA|nr:hypothetical protein Pcac1_g3099 [Phytophthora cactorum]KAG2811274.1 hypothetical protein PC112_g15684 [Phytophthora cactorum]KAG2812173.1 hypothetical protein PC111_g14911 [Phytophthora cactorum]KAG2851541.1 hypothetical protein PC113_g15823 [Phytophthora cactorum]KAG2887926.1 hypothetical protein PC114_g18616 [Phytophthora cactorum]
MDEYAYTSLSALRRTGFRTTCIPKTSTPPSERSVAGSDTAGSDSENDDSDPEEKDRDQSESGSEEADGDDSDYQDTESEKDEHEVAHGQKQVSSGTLDEDEMAEYERSRRENVLRNLEFMQQVGLSTAELAERTAIGNEAANEVKRKELEAKCAIRAIRRSERLCRPPRKSPRLEHKGVGNR